MFNRFYLIFQPLLPWRSKLIFGRGCLSLALLLLLPGLQSCQKPVSREFSIADMAPLDIAPAARRFQVLSDQSQLTVRVYRDGRLANLGHNHVISSNDLQGEIYLADTLQNTALELRLPVMTLDVDLPQYRSDAGDEFPGTLDQDTVSGTRANMLSEQQLNAEIWPEIVLRSREVRGSLPDSTVQFDIAVRSHIYTVEVPVHVILADDRMTVTGSFQVNQTDLGLVPFSVMMGALKVKDQLDIHFTIVAEAATPAL
jgi:hypothetical protein